MNHIDCFKKCSELKIRLNIDKTIDEEQQSLLNRERKRWRAIIERLVYVIQFLAGQCLAFRGETTRLFDTNNSKFLKVVEMLSKFDPVMSDHINNIERYQNKKTYMPHYLGIHFQNEIISLLGDAVKKEIISNLTKSKYYSIVLDCKP